MKNILITGGAGFVGLNLVKHLLYLGDYKISVLDNLSKGNYSLFGEIVQNSGYQVELERTNSRKTVYFKNGDICNGPGVDEMMQNQEYVVHLAAATGVIPSIKDPVKDAEVNILGTLNLLQSCVRAKTKRFIFASSAAPLGKQRPPFDEKSLPAPMSPYGASKLAGEAYCTAFAESFTLNTCVLRFSNLYGPHSFHKGSVVAHFFKKILDRKPLIVFGDGLQTRDYLFVEDIVRTVPVILEARSEQISGELFQLGTGTETTLNDLIELIKKVTGKKVSVIYEKERPGEIKKNVTNIDKIRGKIGFIPRVTLKEGIEKTWAWFVENYSSCQV